ncbi:hypothetical protein BDZ94DRAFT_1248207 [Collybia nuda]|uniref:Secreted protein n=1 Tax=Collybia nuda TaxID=64659 RepID=A0A9P5YFL0_9AGAR|nr:hypothetical protein BDZ94DRAFT_1248207 [Collybia nuda]
MVGGMMARLLTHVYLLGGVCFCASNNRLPHVTCVKPSYRMEFSQKCGHHRQTLMDSALVMWNHDGNDIFVLDGVMCG